MWGFTMVLGGVALAVIGFALVWGAPIFALPIAFVAVLVLGAADFRRRRRQARQMHHLRDEAKTSGVEFTERDQRTLVSE
jgi:Flp pilus assembly protein TadB